MSDLRELYQEVILDHNKRPRNFHSLEGANQNAEGYNPLCGDHVTVHLQLEDGVVRDISFEGSGCAISRASASLMTECVKGKTREEALALFEKFRHLVTGENGASPEDEGLGKLEVFCGVSEFPVRVKCASLPWHTLLAALQGKGQPASTEEPASLEEPAPAKDSRPRESAKKVG